MRAIRPDARRVCGLGQIALHIALGLMLYGGAVAHADEARFDYRIDIADNDWRDLNDAERRTLAAHRDRWRNYSPEERARLRGGAQRFMTLSPAERAEVIRGRERYQNLPPAQRQHLREEYRREHGKGRGRDKDD